MPISKSQDDTKTAVVDLSKQLFATLRGRIMKNVLLKFYNFFLVPMYVKKKKRAEGKGREVKGRSEKVRKWGGKSLNVLYRQTELWSEIQGKVTSLSDTSLTQIFEVKSTKDKLINDEKNLKTTLTKMGEQDASFLEASTQFCRIFSPPPPPPSSSHTFSSPVLDSLLILLAL